RRTVVGDTGVGQGSRLVHVETVRLTQASLTQARTVTGLVDRGERRLGDPRGVTHRIDDRDPLSQRDMLAREDGASLRERGARGGLVLDLASDLLDETGGDRLDALDDGLHGRDEQTLRKVVDGEGEVLVGDGERNVEQ